MHDQPEYKQRRKDDPLLVEIHSGIKTMLFVQGIDMDDPKSIDEARADMRFLRNGRIATEESKRTLRKYSIHALLVGFGTIMMAGAKVLLTSKANGQ